MCSVEWGPRHPEVSELFSLAAVLGSVLGTPFFQNENTDRCQEKTVRLLASLSQKIIGQLVLEISITEKLNFLP